MECSEKFSIPMTCMPEIPMKLDAHSQRKIWFETRDTHGRSQCLLQSRSYLLDILCEAVLSITTDNTVCFNNCVFQQ